MELDLDIGQDAATSSQGCYAEKVKWDVVRNGLLERLLVHT